MTLTSLIAMKAKTVYDVRRLSDTQYVSAVPTLLTNYGLSTTVNLKFSEGKIVGYCHLLFRYGIYVTWKPFCSSLLEMTHSLRSMLSFVLLGQHLSGRALSRSPSFFYETQVGFSKHVLTKSTSPWLQLSHTGGPLALSFLSLSFLFSSTLKIVSGPWQQNVASWRPAPRLRLRAELGMQNCAQI